MSNILVLHPGGNTLCKLHYNFDTDVIYDGLLLDHFMNTRLIQTYTENTCVAFYLV